MVQRGLFIICVLVVFCGTACRRGGGGENSPRKQGTASRPSPPNRPTVTPRLNPLAANLQQLKEDLAKRPTTARSVTSAAPGEPLLPGKACKPKAASDSCIRSAFHFRKSQANWAADFVRDEDETYLTRADVAKELAGLLRAPGGKEKIINVLNEKYDKHVNWAPGSDLWLQYAAYMVNWRENYLEAIASHDALWTALKSDIKENSEIGQFISWKREELCTGASPRQTASLPEEPNNELAAAGHAPRM